MLNNYLNFPTPRAENIEHNFECRVFAAAGRRNIEKLLQEASWNAAVGFSVARAAKHSQKINLIKICCQLMRV